MMSLVEGRLSDFLAIYNKRLGHVVPYMVGSPGFVRARSMYVPVDGYRVIKGELQHVSSNCPRRKL